MRADSALVLVFIGGPPQLQGLGRARGWSVSFSLGLNEHSERDPYALFHDRSQAMGWLDDSGTAATAAGLWEMQEAGYEHPLADPEVSLAAWFQIGMEPVSGERPLPVQPFLRCAGDAVARIGTLRLQAVQVVLPVDGLDPSASPMPPSLFTADWFVDGDPRASTPVRVTVDSGQVPSVPAAAPRIQEEISRLSQDVFVYQSYSLTDHDSPAMQPPFADHFWNGPPLHRATFHGTLAEWSLDAVGWLGGFLTDLSARHGVTTPLVLTASRE